VGHVVRVGEVIDAYSFLVVKHEGKRPLGRPRRRPEDNIRLHLGGIGWGSCGLDASDSGLEPVVGSCEHGNEHSGSIEDVQFDYLRDY